MSNIELLIIAGVLTAVLWAIVAQRRHSAFILAELDKPKPPEKASLIITTNDKRDHWFNYEGAATFDGHPVVRKFARWYFNKDKPEYFVMPTDNGYDVILRSGIMHIAIKKGE